MKANIVIVFTVAAIVICVYLLVKISEGYLIKSVHPQNESRNMSSIRNYSGVFFPDQDIRNIISNKFQHYKFHEPSLILLLGKEGCSSCQIKEMKRLNYIYNKIRADLDIFAIYYNNKSMGSRSDRYEALLLRKTSGTNYQIFYTNNSYYRVFGSLPKLIFVHDNICDGIYHSTQDNSQYREDNNDLIINDLKDHLKALELYSEGQ